MSEQGIRLLASVRQVNNFKSKILYLLRSELKNEESSMYTKNTKGLRMSELRKLVFGNNILKHYSIKALYSGSLDQTWIKCDPNLSLVI